MDKKYVEVPKNDFDKIIFVANLSAELSGEPTSKETILKSIKDRDLVISEEQLNFIETNFA